MSASVPLSVLDLAPIARGSTPGDALRNSLDLARHAERLGYQRHWVAEHHNMPGIASAATSVVIGYLAGGTSTIRVGAGGIMLPNHSPLVIAEQFGTLESLYPGRIDLGLGRAPGTDQLTSRALRRGLQSEDEFPRDVQELQYLLGPGRAGAGDPGGAGRRAGGAALDPRLEHLRRPPRGRPRPPLRLCLALRAHAPAGRARCSIAASSSPRRSSRRRTRWRASTSSRRNPTTRHAGCSRRRSNRGRTASAGWQARCPPPIDDIESYWTPAEKAQASAMLTYSVVGAPETVRAGVEQFVELTGVDELMVVSAIHDHAARLRSYEILAGI